MSFHQVRTSVRLPTPELPCKSKMNKNNFALLNNLSKFDLCEYLLPNNSVTKTVDNLTTKIPFQHC